MTRKKSSPSLHLHRKNLTKNNHYQKQQTDHINHLWMRTSDLVQRLLQTLEEGIANPENLPAYWVQIFGPKDNAVVNLQKLVAVLTVVSERLMSELYATKIEQPNTERGAMQPEDLEMVMRWAARELETLKPSGAPLVES
jgi:hypothetical protein